ncbi:hypothetical protein ACWEIJ_06835 [Lentzea sp. NPDC004789]
MKRGIIATAFVLLGFAFPGIAHAETVPGCSSAVQIGSTGYVKYRGNNIASVKQFAGCGHNYGYVYTWESFRSQMASDHLGWGLQVGVLTYSSASDPEPNAIKGGNSTQYSLKELWGKPADTLNVCTTGYGMVSIQMGENYTAESSRRC